MEQEWIPAVLVQLFSDVEPELESDVIQLPLSLV